MNKFAIQVKTRIIGSYFLFNFFLSPEFACPNPRASGGRQPERKECRVGGGKYGFVQTFFCPYPKHEKVPYAYIRGWAEKYDYNSRLPGRRALVVVFIKNMLFEIIAFVVFECL